MPLAVLHDAFDDASWVFEVKYCGIRGKANAIPG